MTNMGDVVRMLKKEHDRLTKQVQGISAALSAFGAAYGKQNGVRGKKMTGAGPKRRKMSAAARKKIAAAQRLRWAKVKAAQKKTA